MFWLRNKIFFFVHALTEGLFHDKPSRPLVKSVYQNINFLISQPKHMLWVLKRTVSMLKLMGKKIFTILC